MDELQVLYDYSSLGLEDFAQSPDETEEEAKERDRRFRNPGLYRALMHIAYQRKHPRIPASQVKKLVGSANVLGSLASLFVPVEEAADEIPLASTSEPAPSSPSGSLDNENLTPDSSANGGKDSTNGSDEQAVIPTPIGTTRSATSSTVSRGTSAA